MKEHRPGLRGYTEGQPRDDEAREVDDGYDAFGDGPIDGWKARGRTSR